VDLELNLVVQSKAGEPQMNCCCQEQL